jgi:hypothetical protein
MSTHVSLWTRSQQLVLNLKTPLRRRRKVLHIERSRFQQRRSAIIFPS